MLLRAYYRLIISSSLLALGLSEGGCRTSQSLILCFTTQKGLNLDEAGEVSVFNAAV